MTSLLKTAVIGASALLGCACAQAADLPGPATLPMAPSLFTQGNNVGAYRWTGAYIGAVVGDAFQNTAAFRESGVTAFDAGAGTTRPGRFAQHPDGILGGAEIGYNTTLGATPFGILHVPGSDNLLVGVEADAMSIDGLGTSRFVNANIAGEPTRSTFHGGTDFLGTLRGRLGIAFDDFLFYGTGGLAYGDVIERAAYDTPGNDTQLRYFGRNNGLQLGYVYGGGVSFALPNLPFIRGFIPGTPIMKLEYLSYDLGGRTMLIRNVTGTPPGSAYLGRTAYSGDLFKIGVDYQF